MEMYFPFSVLPLLLLALASVIRAQEEQCHTGMVIPPAELQALLPQSLEFDDSAHEPNLAARDDPFLTPAESSNFTETATYEEVSEFFTRLAEESDYVQVKSLVTLANGEDLWLVTVSGEMQFEAAAMTKPIVLATGAIHPGESSGVNAGMMFLRNLVLKEEYSDLLSKVNFLFIPVLNIQGYLRQSVNGRINQHGPRTSGRRANGHFYNLNRDFAKLDTPEVRALVSVMNEYDVAFYTE
jgi:murein tripeptide amidase MpaA